MLPQHLVGWGDWGSAIYGLHFESQGSRLLLGWKEINRGEKDGIRFVFFVFDKKCIVVWTPVVWECPNRSLSFLQPRRFWGGLQASLHIGMITSGLLVLVWYTWDSCSFSSYLYWNGIWWSSHEKITNHGGHPSFSSYFALHHWRDEGLCISKAAPFFL